MHIMLTIIQFQNNEKIDGKQLTMLDKSTIASKIKGLKDYKHYLVSRINEEKTKTKSLKNLNSLKEYKKLKRDIDKQIKNLLIQLHNVENQ